VFESPGFRLALAFASLAGTTDYFGCEFLSLRTSLQPKGDSPPSDNGIAAFIIMPALGY
jgi:hypothetical protein